MITSLLAAGLIAASGTPAMTLKADTSEPLDVGDESIASYSLPKLNRTIDSNDKGYDLRLYMDQYLAKVASAGWTKAKGEAIRVQHYVGLYYYADKTHDSSDIFRESVDQVMYAKTVTFTASFDYQLYDISLGWDLDWHYDKTTVTLTKTW